MKKLFLILLLIYSLQSIAQHKYRSSSDKKDLGIGMIIGGTMLSTSLILESQHSYGTYVNKTNNYIIPPFYKQFPKNLFFVAGVSVTITGIFQLKNK